MTIVRWILWIGIGGVALWLFDRFFGEAAEPVGLVTPDQLQDPASQVGTRGTGLATRDAVESSWRTTFTDLAEQAAVRQAWRNQFGTDVVNSDPGDEKTLQTYVTLGDQCTAAGGETALTINNGQPVVAYCGGNPRVWRLV
jgi:hypothetical protein